MDANHFDNVARKLATGSRRWFGRSMRGLALGGMALLPPRLDTAAKRKGKKKKKCKRGTKKCGRKCIPSSQCCTTNECSPTFACINGNCQCDTNWRLCGDQCVHNGVCCTTADCTRQTPYCANDICQCQNGGCHCQGVSAEGKCCKIGDVFNVSTRTCQPGPCPNVINCSDEIYLCGTAQLQGSCARSASGNSECVDDANESRICMTCSSDSTCETEMGPGAVCVNPGGCRCGGFGTASYCARVIPQ